jgi:hypothetical protein
VRLEAQNIPAFQTEDFMPPENELKARVDFTYSDEPFESDVDKFWRKIGKKLNVQMEDFVGKHKAMKQAVTQIVSPNGGELVALPTQPSGMNGIQRKGKLTLDASGNLKGDISEIRVGDRAWSQRWALRTVTKDSDRIKPIESLLASSLSNFQITKASVTNLQVTALWI